MLSKIIQCNTYSPVSNCRGGQLPNFHFFSSDFNINPPPPICEYFEKIHSLQFITIPPIYQYEVEFRPPLIINPPYNQRRESIVSIMTLLLFTLCIQTIFQLKCEPHSPTDCFILIMHYSADESSYSFIGGLCFLDEN